MKQVTIHSDGFGGKNSVIVTEDGELVDNVIEATIQLQAGQVTEATLVMQHVATVVQGLVREVIFECRFCNTSQLHYCDGMASKPPDPDPAWPSQEDVSKNIQAAQPQMVYVPCGAAFETQDDKKEMWTCYVDHNTTHIFHTDVIYGGIWKHDSGGLMWKRLRD